MKLVSYNIQHSRGRDERYDLARIAGAIDGADIIALQEVERFWPRTGMTDQPAELSAMLPGYYWVYGPGFDMDASTAEGGIVENRRRQFGNMLLTRWPIVSSRLYVLPKLRSVDHFNMDMPALEGVVETEAGPLRVWSIHLSSVSGRERLLQIEYLRELHGCATAGGGAWTGPPEIRGDNAWSCGAPPPPMPADAIWMGDFNMQPGSEEYDAIAGRPDPLNGRVIYDGDFVDAWVAAGHATAEGVTYEDDGRFGDLRIDHCFVSAPLAERVKGAWIDDDADGSDHQPVWTELELSAAF